MHPLTINDFMKRDSEQNLIIRNGESITFQCRHTSSNSTTASLVVLSHFLSKCIILSYFFIKSLSVPWISILYLTLMYDSMQPIEI